MNDLVEFLKARLDEDERAAHAAGRMTLTDTGVHPHHWRVNVEDDVVVRDSGEYIATGPHGGSVGGAAEHIARHDPARVLAEVDAKRRIADRCWTYVGPHFLAADDVLKLLALPYAGHPDYQREWAA